MREPISTRRRYLLGIASGLTTVLSGCLGGDSGGGGPAVAARRYYEALYSGDAETFDEVVHSESAYAGEGETFVRDDSKREVVDTEVVERDDGSAIVEVTIETADGDRGTVTIQARTEDGEWKVLPESG